MPYVRLLAGAAAAILTAGSALAQTGGATGYGAATQPASPTGAGAMQSPSTATQPYAPPPTTGGMAQPSATSSSGGAPMTGGSMGAPGMAGGAASGFRPLSPNPSASIVAALQASGQFTKLLAALQATNLTNLISTHPNLTLFAPTDAAFAQLPPGQLDQLMKSPAQLQAILTYHLVATTIKPSDIQGHAAGPVPAADNKQLTVDGSGPSLRVNDAVVLQPGVAASNGVIYPINKVLTPPGA
jgi:uncharacterized surface protein with fasciclin (FAS1) repeats